MDLSPLLSKATVGSAGETGSWRTYKPVINYDLCSRCGNCQAYCPEGIINKDIQIDYRFCKGCGICKEVCDQRAIEMVPE